MAQGYGAKVSLPGFNAETAADQNLYFSSSWPTLKIDMALSNTMTLTGGVDSVTHNLNYPPFVMVWSHANGFYPVIINGINSTTVSFKGTAGDTIRYYIFRNPLNINFLAPNIKLEQTQQGTNHQNWGVKFAKPNKNIKSDDLRDYTIHSGTKSLQVHQVIYQKLGTFSDINLGFPSVSNSIGLKYVTDLSYNPVFFAFYSSDNVNFVPLFATSQNPPKINFNSIDGGIIINDNGGAGGWGVLYILLDPYLTTTQVSTTL